MKRGHTLRYSRLPAKRLPTKISEIITDSNPSGTSERMDSS